MVSRPSFRSRNRPVISWGPPPVAAYNMTQLPFKIDETPSKSTRCPDVTPTPITTTTTKTTEPSSPPLATIAANAVVVNDDSNDSGDETDEGLFMTMHNSNNDENGVEIVKETNEL